MLEHLQQLSLTPLMPQLEHAPRVIYQSWLVTLYDPRDIPTNLHLLEIIFVWGFLATLRHALAERREGRPYGLLLWLTALFYGVFMELLTYNTIDNFAHAQFTVQFYHCKLPVYVVMLYPTFVYVAVQAARRLGMGAVGTFFTAGALAVMIDVPFDIMGPDDRWWWWYEGAEDPMNLLAARWLGVPVTSYCWHLLFEGSQQWVSERFRGRVERNYPPERGLFSTLVGMIPLTLLTGLLSVVVGIIVMMPFHGFRALGLSDYAFTVTLFVVSALAFVTARKREDTRPPEWRLLGWVLGWYALFFYYAATVWTAGKHEDIQLKFITYVVVAAVSIGLHSWIHHRGMAREPNSKA